MDTQASFLTYLYEILTLDDDLVAACGGEVRLFPVWATPDAEFPYLVQRLDIRAADVFPLRQGTLIIDIWSYSPNMGEALDIRERLIGIIDQLDFSTDEISHCRISLETDGFIPEIEQGIWHYACQFGCRFYRVSEISAILGRNNNYEYS